LASIGGVQLARCQPIRDQPPGKLDGAMMLDLQSLGQFAG
jgi:hypothetical protein